MVLQDSTQMMFKVKVKGVLDPLIFYVMFLMLSLIYALEVSSPIRCEGGSQWMVVPWDLLERINLQMTSCLIIRNEAEHADNGGYYSEFATPVARR